MVHPAVLERLARLAPDQRAAATASPGPVLCVAPAGSGKTTTLVARVAWLIAEGADPASVTALTFNRRAAEELAARLGPALEPVGAAVHSATTPGVRVRTFHALGLEILRAAGERVEPLVERDAVLRAVMPGATGAERRRLDTVISRLKLDLGATLEAVAADDGAGPTAQAFVAYERAVAATGGLDFDDLVVRSVRRLESRPDVLATWRRRCAHLLVDEAQDLDRSQLRMALLLSAPEHRIFLVGDDDQSIYGWRLADVRRLLGLAETALPGLRRVDLVTNYRCPATVVDRAVRLIEHNEERFAKRIVARSPAPGPVVLAATGDDDVERCRAVLERWRSNSPAAESEQGPGQDPTFAILARTNRELVPAAVAAVDLGVPFRVGDLALPIEAPDVDPLLAAAAAAAAGGGAARQSPLIAVAIGAAALPGPEHDDAAIERRDLVAAVLSWAAAYPSVEALGAAIAEHRSRLASLRRDDAALSLATAHGTKGLEFDHVAVIGMDAHRFPSARSIADAAEPRRALEEERRLAYVAWTRARRSLTLVYDPAAPSPFLLEAFTSEELGIAGSLPSGA